MIERVAPNPVATILEMRDTLALTARRLRDAGFHVAWTLLAFVPGLGSLVLFCLLIQPTGRRFP